MAVTTKLPKVSESTQVIAAVIAALRAAKGLVLTTHKDPDGDGLSCALALQCWLQGQQKSCVVVAKNLPAQVNYLPGFGQVLEQVPPDFNYDTVVALDCGNRDRIVMLPGLSWEAKTIINIDHHMDNSMFGDINFVAEGAAVGETIYALWQQSGVAIDQAVATCLYTACFTDTGGFRYSNTQAATFAVAQACLAAGAPIAEIALRTLGSKPKAVFDVFRDALNTLELVGDGRLVYAVVDAEKHGDATREAIDLIRDVESCEVAVVFRVYPSEKKVKVNLRSKRSFNVQAVARVFGGGGHERASGVEMTGDLAEIKSQVVAEILSRF